MRDLSDFSLSSGLTHQILMMQKTMHDPAQFFSSVFVFVFFTDEISLKFVSLTFASISHLTFPQKKETKTKMKLFRNQADFYGLKISLKGFTKPVSVFLLLQDLCCM